jgi:hypothetical protein
MQAYRGVEVYLHSFFITALDGGEWFNFMPRPKRNWVDSRAGLKVLETRKILVQAQSQNTTPWLSSLQPSHYPGSRFSFRLGEITFEPNTLKLAFWEETLGRTEKLHDAWR